MSLLSGKKVLLGVTAGIAAYKSAWLVRSFIKAGAQVKVVMTPNAKDFVAPLTLATLSKNEVLSSFVTDDEDNPNWNNHVELGLWADFLVIAPATANTLAKMSTGTCDNLLLATYLSAKCPVFFAPAMDLDMYKHPSTLETFKKLESFGNRMIPATSGELASGLEGKGRMAEPEAIVEFIEHDIQSRLPLKNKTVLITAGPTYEAIDPVRFIGNHSSGKMGYALAREGLSLGAQVILISGPTSIHLEPHKNLKLIQVVSARDMFEAVQKEYDQVHVAVAAAAVADYKPSVVADQKIKKKNDLKHLTLEPTEDILAFMGEHKTQQFLVGFALETENEIDNAKGKLLRKNLDLIVLNSLKDTGAGFGSQTNKVTLITKNEEITPYDLKPKDEVAKDIFTKIRNEINV